MADRSNSQPELLPVFAPAIMRVHEYRIHVSCRAVPSRTGFRLEIRLQAGGKTAIVDVAPGDGPHIEARTREATSAFARTLRACGAPRS